MEKKKVHFVKGFQYWIITLIIWLLTKPDTETTTELLASLLGTTILTFLCFSLLVFIKRKIFGK